METKIVSEANRSSDRRVNWFSLFALAVGIFTYLLPTPKGKQWLDWVTLFLLALNVLSMVVYWRRSRG